MQLHYLIRESNSLLALIFIYIFRTYAVIRKIKGLGEGVGCERIKPLPPTPLHPYTQSQQVI